MIRRRSPFNGLERSSEPRWLTTRAFTGALLEARRLEPGVDLVHAFLVAILELVDTGWTVGEFSSVGAVQSRHGAADAYVEDVDPARPAR